MKRQLLFLDYWSLHEPLTQATVLPTVRMLLEEGWVDRVVLVTVERGRLAVEKPSALGLGVDHRPLVAGKGGPRPLVRGMDLLRMAPRIASIVREEQAGFLMARGVVAGGFAHFVEKRSGIPYAVDYFEPHNEYMTDVGEWSKGGVLDRSLAWLIRQQQRSARYCVTVSGNYRERLVSEGADGSRLLVAPCPVDEVRMRYDPQARAALREQLGWSSARVGVYAGKFGGLYHREHAYRAFVEAQRCVGLDFGLIILTPHAEEEVRAGLHNAGFVGDRLLVKYVGHEQVAPHLSVADFAFAPYRGTPSSACISPMKVGEYWANGLPVLLTRGVGDDSAIVAVDPFAGALFDPEGNDLKAALERVLGTIARPDQRERTTALAGIHRGMDRTREVYRRILGEAWPSA